MKEIKPCIFCGSTNVQINFAGSAFTVDCNECDCVGPTVPAAQDPHCDQDAAIEAWNRPHEGKEALQAALRDLVGQIESCDGTAQLNIDMARELLG